MSRDENGRIQISGLHLTLLGVLISILTVGLRDVLPLVREAARADGAQVEWKANQESRIATEATERLKADGRHEELLKQIGDSLHNMDLRLDRIERSLISGPKKGEGS